QPQLRRTAELVAKAGPLELSWLLKAFENDAQTETGLLLVQSLGSSPGLAGIAPEKLSAVVKNYPVEVQSAIRPLVERATPDDQQRLARLKNLETATKGGEASKGEDVFFSQRAACSACHRIGARGEKIGPDLSKIGEVRNQRDLLEAVLFP